MKLPDFRPRKDSTLLDGQVWLRAVQSILSNGITIGDQMAGQVRDCVWNTGALPMVSTTLLRKPVSIVLLSAATAADPGTMVSGAAVTWMWLPSPAGGAVLITDVAGLTPLTDYALSLWLVGG